MINQHDRARILKSNLKGALTTGNSVANGGLFSAKWLILKIFGGQKKWLISHQNVAYFEPSKWLKVA